MAKAYEGPEPYSSKPATSHFDFGFPIASINPLRDDSQDDDSGAPNVTVEDDDDDGDDGQTDVIEEPGYQSPKLYKRPKRHERKVARRTSRKERREERESRRIAKHERKLARIAARKAKSSISKDVPLPSNTIGSIEPTDREAPNVTVGGFGEIPTIVIVGGIAFAAYLLWRKR